MAATQSVQKIARIAALLILLSVVAGGFGEAYVPSVLIVPGNATATARNLVASAPLLRLGFIGYLTEALCDVALTWALYVLLRPVHRDLALLAVFLRLIGTSTFVVAEVVYFSASRIVGGAEYLKTLSPDQLASLALLTVRVSAFGQTVSGMFYGAGTAFFGYLIARSSFLPRILGVLLAIAGVGFVAATVIAVLAPGTQTAFLLAPTILALGLLMLWLFVKGVDVAKWEASAASSRA